ncbi:MAG: diadenylate cyclase, partial [Candidatus Woesearchaeota archaeon]|nr:diadenylate cyclase [Candidatus Woesearchaeota archaeon]
ALESAEDDRFLDVDVIIFRKTRKSAYRKVNYKTRMRKLFQDSVAPLKEILAEAINREYIKKGDRVVCVQDGSLGMGYKGLLFIFDVDNIFFSISATHLSEGMSSDVIESVINIALEISKEGFEGKSVGTAFVIGDRDELLRYSKQMIINPFAGYPEECRRITDPELKQTIKNFAQLDGVFLIDTGGVVLSAGVYLNVDVDKELCDSLIGFGTRHRCCAAITKCTSAVSVVLSQSGGKIRIFKNGKIILKMP